MTDKFKVLQLPTQPLQKNIPLELEMARDIARENVTGELLKARFEEAGVVAKFSCDLCVRFGSSLGGFKKSKDAGSRRAPG